MLVVALDPLLNGPAGKASSATAKSGSQRGAEGALGASAPDDITDMPIKDRIPLHGSCNIVDSFQRSDILKFRHFEP